MSNFRQKTKKAMNTVLSKVCGIKRQGHKKAMIFSQILECSKSSGVHSTERNLPLEVELPCSLVKESLNFSNLVFSNLYLLCLWRFSHFFSDNRRTS